MKALAALSAIAALILAGCGGQSSALSSGNVAAGETGKLQISVKWPDSRAIPPDATRIRLKFFEPNRSGIPMAYIERPNSSASFDVPAGHLVVKAAAVNAASVVLASAEGSVDLQPHGTGTVQLTMESTTPTVGDGVYVVGGSVAADDEQGYVRITLPALVSRTDGKPALGLTEANFQVFEDDVRKRPLQVIAAANSGGKADIAFIVDTTGSMGGEIDGVRSSLNSFATYLAGQGMDIRYAGVSFGDEVRGQQDFTDVTTIDGWIASLDASGGDDTPENPLDAIMTAVGSFGWRADAQHLILIITDAPAHQNDEFTSRTIQSVLDSIKGKYVCHVVSPGTGRALRSAANRPGLDSVLDEAADIDVLAGGTGGVWTAMPSDGNVDLTALPVKDLVAAGYTVRFQSIRYNVDHLLRLVVVDGSTSLAEQTFEGHY